MMLGASATLVQAVPKQDGAKHCVGECQSGLGANPPISLPSRCFGREPTFPRDMGPDKEGERAAHPGMLCFGTSGEPS